LSSADADIGLTGLILTLVLFVLVFVFGRGAEIKTDLEGMV